MLQRAETIMKVSTKTRVWPSGTIPFDCDGDVGDPQSHQFFMSREIWLEMGSPEIITLAVVPGDALNEIGG